jgi:hypothetical protein
MAAAAETTPIYDDVVGALLIDPVKLAAEIDAEMTALRNTAGGAVQATAADPVDATDAASTTVADPPTEEIPVVTP